jgi:pyruvyltransferase
MIAGRMPSLPNDPSINKCSLAVVGSILEWGARYVWGPGFINSNGVLPKETERVFALRGPTSFRIAKTSPFQAQQTVAPVYGDPGLLMSWFYQPHNQAKNYSLCLMPHYADTRASPLVSILSQWKGVHQLDIRGPLFEIMDEIVKCEFVLSSSLHGIIFADSFGIPNAHMNVSARVTGGSYKFDDYFAAMNRTRTTLELVNRTSVKMDEVKAIMKKSDQASNINLLPLWQNAPMHAQAYNRTREAHLQFAKEYAQKFTETLDKKPINLKSFFDQMSIQY